jgi:hypothetical protein
MNQIGDGAAHSPCSLALVGDGPVLAPPGHRRRSNRIGADSLCPWRVGTGWSPAVWLRASCPAAFLGGLKWISNPVRRQRECKIAQDVAREFMRNAPAETIATRSKEAGSGARPISRRSGWQLKRS